MSDEIEPVTEIWTFGGSRVGSTGKRVHEWITPDRSALWYKPVGGYTVGSRYVIKVVRTDSKTTRYGDPQYSGRSDDLVLVDELSARHRAAEVTLAVSARERKDKTDDPLELAINRLAELAAHVPPSQRANFAAYVSQRLNRFW